MVPPFDLQGGLPLAVARAATVTALLSLFGTQTFQTLVAPKAYARMAPREIGVTRRRLHNLTLISLLGAALATAVWLVLESGHFADAATPAEALAAIWPVLTETFFGHVIAAQLAVLAVFAVIQISEGKNPRETRCPPQITSHSCGVAGLAGGASPLPWPLSPSYSRPVTATPTPCTAG